MITLVLGGARSGKSELAEQLAGTGRAVTYLATGTAVDADMAVDTDMAARIARHRARRPDRWRTLECGGGAALATALAETAGPVLLDSLGTWVAATPDFEVDTAALCGALRARAGDAVVVSDEVGLGVHPETEVGRRFRDVLGEVNRAVADVADRALLVVAGRVLPLERP